MSRPDLSPEDRVYYEAWAYLLHDRPFFSHSYGLGGSIMLQQKSPRAAIEAEGERRHFRGDDLEDFVEIIAGLQDDDFDESYRVKSEALAAANEAAATRNRNR